MNMMIDDMKWLFNGLYQLNIRTISALAPKRPTARRPPSGGIPFGFYCFFSPLLCLGLDATLPIKSARFSMIQKPRDTSIYAILHTSTHTSIHFCTLVDTSRHFYTPLHTSICWYCYSYIWYTSINLLYFLDLLALLQIDGVSKLWFGWLKLLKRPSSVLESGMWRFFIFRLSPATSAGRAAATLTDGLGRPFHVQ